MKRPLLEQPTYRSLLRKPGLLHARTLQPANVKRACKKPSAFIKSAFGWRS